MLLLLLLLRSKQLSKAKLDKTYRYVRQTAKKTTFITFATYVFVLPFVVMKKEGFSFLLLPCLLLLEHSRPKMEKRIKSTFPKKSLWLLQ